MELDYVEATEPSRRAVWNCNSTCSLHCFNPRRCSSRPKPAPELFLTLHGEPRNERDRLWTVAELDGLVRNEKYSESSMKDHGTGFRLTWFEHPLTPEEHTTAIRLLRLARDYERQRKEYNALTTEIESRSSESLHRFDALFKGLAGTRAATPEGIKAKYEIIASEFADFSDEFISDAALHVLQHDIPAVLAAKAAA